MKRKEEREIEESSGLSKFTFIEWARMKHVRLYIARGAGIKAGLTHASLATESVFDQAITNYLNQGVGG